MCACVLCVLLTVCVVKVFSEWCVGHGTVECRVGIVYTMQLWGDGNVHLVLVQHTYT